MARKKGSASRIRAAYFGDGPGALASPAKFAAAHPEFSARALARFFADDYSAKQFFPKKRALKKYVHRSTARYFGDRVQADLAFIGQSVILVCVDVYTKFLSTRFQPNKTSVSTAHAFHRLYGQDYARKLWLPWRDGQVTVLHDDGSEFKARFRSRCLELGVVNIVLPSGSKAVLAERMIGIIRRRVHLLSEHYGVNDLPKYVAKITRAWNATESALLGGASPLNLRDRKREALAKYEKVRDKTTWDDEVRHYRREIADHHELAVGKWVRISSLGQTVFTKGSERETNLLELFRIRQIRWPSLANRSDAPYLKLEDYAGQPILGVFKLGEIVLTRQDPRSDSFRGTVQSKEKISAGFWRVQLAGK